MSLVTKREAIRLGRKRGIAGASWMFDGNTSDATYRAFLKGCEEVDPMILDSFSVPDWLSGQWAGASLNELLGECTSKRDEDRLADVMNAYCDAADAAYWQELERIARYHTRAGDNTMRYRVIIEMIVTAQTDEEAQEVVESVIFPTQADRNAGYESWDIKDMQNADED